MNAKCEAEGCQADQACGDGCVREEPCTHPESDHEYDGCRWDGCPCSDIPGTEGYHGGPPPERFYSNICLACLGQPLCIHRVDDGPWIPSPEEIAAAAAYDALHAIIEEVDWRSMPGKTTASLDFLARAQNEAISGPLPPRSHLPTSTPPEGPQEPQERPQEAPQCPDALACVCDHPWTNTMTQRADAHCGHWMDMLRCCWCGSD